MERKIIFEVKKDERCFFKITSDHWHKNISSYICLNWSGLVDQFRNGESTKEIKDKAIYWLENKIKKGFDNQYSDNVSSKWLLKELKKSNQLELFKVQINIFYLKKEYNNRIKHHNTPTLTFLYIVLGFFYFNRNVKIKNSQKKI